jgi:hypothetical protein
MRSGARCEGALLGTVLGGIVISILTSCYGNAGTEFSKRSGGVSNRWSKASGEVPLPYWLFQKEIHAIEIDDGMTVVQRVHP